MKRILDTYYRFLKVLLTLLLGGMLVPVILQIASRSADQVPHFIWTEEAARFCFVWIVMIGSMIAVRDDRHFRVDLLPKPETAQHEAIGQLMVHGAMTVMALMFAWYGYKFAEFGWDQTSEMSGINMLSIYISFPLAGITWLIFLIEKIVDDVKKISGDGPGGEEWDQAK